MIVDRLEHATRYTGLHSSFARAFQWLRQPQLDRLEDGRHEIEGNELFAVISRECGRGREAAMLEVHRRYLDVQFVIQGQESIGWLSLADCRRVAVAYQTDKDIEFYYDRPETWLAMPTGTFAVLFPEDAHAPLAASGEVHKVIVKIMVEPGDPKN